MIDAGYESVYNYTYSHITTYNELINIKSNCNYNTIICVGGSEYNSDNLLLVSCGNCNQVLTNTSLNNTQLINGAYWYLKSNYSFGFSSNQNILQYYADTYDCTLNNNKTYECSDNNRLSWHLTEITGGWRVGTINGLNTSPSYKKYIFLKDFINQKTTKNSNDITKSTEQNNIVTKYK